ncbi:DUF4492 domain-containing protein [Marinilabilia salmonicolor]|uniref:DUF4492 domain-containing protein n=1 Tax=Marinilabilia salmonicolor TaxID=989 RepID=UPI0002FDBBCA|nr:DUF4492 domain-containing protein [Marinilabilia salmonicolor]
MEKLRKIVNFYVTGFQNLPPWGRALWAIILIKLFIMFVVLRLFFFPDQLQNNFKSDEERARHVIENITTP